MNSPRFDQILREGQRLARPATTAAAAFARRTIDRALDPRTRKARIIAAVAVAALLAFVGLAVLLIKPDTLEIAPTGTQVRRAASPDRASSTVGGEKAAADLEQLLERLRQNAAPSANTSFDGLRTVMNREPSTRTPWSAIISGIENTRNPETQEVVQRTEFALNAAYTYGIWTYVSYRASVTDVPTSSTTEARHNALAPAPPLVVALLGLKLPELEAASTAPTASP